MLVYLENGQYLLCSGGDDGAVAFVSFKIHTVNEELDICLWSVVSVPDAHTSGATGRYWTFLFKVVSPDKLSTAVSHFGLIFRLFNRVTSKQGWLYKANQK